VVRNEESLINAIGHTKQKLVPHLVMMWFKFGRSF